VVEARRVRRLFGANEALRDVSLVVGAGEVHALLGRNGAGKTTLLRVLTGLLDASSGDVRVAGIDVRGSPRDVRRLIGVVPSGDRSFYGRLSGLENLVFFARLHGFRHARARERALRALASVGLKEHRSGWRSTPACRCRRTRTGCRSGCRSPGRC
jgi:ABC-2 type transport system ATP-binding protein